MKNQLTKTIACALAGLSLSACGGGGGDTITYEIAPLSTVLSQANSSENIVASLEVTESLTLHSTSAQTLSVENQSGQFSAVVNGVRHSFPRTDGRSVLGSSNSLTRPAYLTRIPSYVDDISDDVRNNYLLLNYGVFNTTTRRASFGFAVMGVPTPPDAIPTTSSASYSGRTVVHSLTFDSPARVVFLNGNIQMNVNFASRQISGSITNIVDAAGVYPIPRNARISLNNANFGSDGRYNGRLTLGSSFAQSVGVVSISRATYRGGTYGSEANSLVGVLDVSGATTEGDQFRAIGGFHADR